jgi:hypothetical protein
VRASSSESLLLLLEEAGFFVGCCCTGVDVDNGLVGATVDFFFLSSSLDESESDELSFFFTGAATEVLATGVTVAIEKEKQITDILLIKRFIPFDVTGFLLVGLSSSSESLLLDEAAFLTGC